jgi:hypothetical protein
MITARPIVAMLWQNWRLTRIEAAQRLTLGLVLGGGTLLVPDMGATFAFWILITVHSMIWFSVAKLNGGQFSDGYKPGFPFHLLYTRPVSTTMLVGVAIIYDAVSCVVLYLLSAALFGLVFGVSLPLFSVVLWLVAYHFSYACVQWSSRNRAVQWVGSFAIICPIFLLLYLNVASPPQVEFSPLANAGLVVTAAVMFVLTVAGVARQRRGDAVAVVAAQKEISGGYPDWLVTPFKFSCPTSSATRAQLWFELKSSGLPVLVIGLGAATVVFLLCAISTAFGIARFLALPVAMVATLIVFLALGSNAFGIRRKQGRTYTSSFEMTQPYGTAQMASIKVLVRTACLLVALAAMVVSLWAASSVVGPWGEWVLNNNQDVRPQLMKVQEKFAGGFGGLTAFGYAALAIAVSIAVASIVAWQAAREALRARYLRILLVVQWLPAIWGLASLALALAHNKGLVSVLPVRVFFTASFWVSLAALLLTAAYLLWSSLAQRALPVRYAAGALLIPAAFAAAWWAGMPSTSLIGLSWPVLLILMVVVLAPWSLGRVRHT